MTPARRAVLVLKILDALRQQIERAGGHYHGGMTPNLQSAIDALVLPDFLLENQLRDCAPAFVPTDDEERELAAGWAQLMH
jgi:hypothetical protein